MGVGQQNELGQLVQNQTIESLAKVQEDGTLKPWLASGWTVSPDRLMITIDLRTGVRFHDGSAVTPEVVAGILRDVLPHAMGPASDDVLSVAVGESNKVEIKLKRPSSFALEAASEAQIENPHQKGSGTGPFMTANHDGVTEMRANADYYLGRPNLDRIIINTYPSARSAWAELLRNNVDMVYELGVDAIDSLEPAAAIRVFSFVRRYQYSILLNPKVPALHSPAIRRALNLAIDRELLVHQALNGHGRASSGPVWPKNWAFDDSVGGFTYQPAAALAAFEAAQPQLKKHDGAKARVAFTCLVAPEAARVALAVRQQLEAFGVEMNVEEASLTRINKEAADGTFEAILGPTISGPTIFRPYLWWYSHGPSNRGGYSSAPVDAALDTIDHARSDDEYRHGVADFERSIVADPPAIFLAWDERARAVSNRFDVPVEPGLDIIGALHLWRPAAGAARPGTN